MLERFLRDGEPVSGDFFRKLREAVDCGDLELLAARTRGEVVGVAAVAYRLSISLGGVFAGVEDLYVVPDARRRGVGRTLMEAVEDRCAARGVSYVEVQAVSDEAEAFYEAVGFGRETGVRVMSRSLPLRG